jgi:WD40 repeat protein
VQSLTRHVHALASAPDGSWLVVAGIGGVIELHDVATGTCRAVLSDETRKVGGVLKLAVASDGSWLVSVGPDHEARVWDLAADVEQAFIDHSGMIAVDVVIAPNGTWLATVGRNGSVRLSDPHGDVWAALRLDSQLGYCVLNPARPQLVVAGSRHVYFLDIHSD